MIHCNDPICWFLWRICRPVGLLCKVLTKKLLGIHKSDSQNPWPFNPFHANLWTNHEKSSNNVACYIAGIFPLIVRALIGQFGITWHLTMKLFPAKSLWAGNIARLLRQRVTMQCYPRMMTEDRRCTWTECDWGWCDHSVWLARFSNFCIAMATPSRFADLSRQEIAGLVEEKDSKNTQSATKTALSTLKPSAERNVLTKSRILTKFQKKN